MEICITCDKILRVWPQSADYPKMYRFKLSDWLSSASSCRVCDLFLSCPLVSSHPYRQHQFDEGKPCVKDLLSGSLVALSEADTVTIRFEPDCDGRLSKLRMVIETMTDTFDVSAAAWASEGSHAAGCGRVCTTTPLTDDNSPSAFRLIRARIDNCLRDHQECNIAMSGQNINECGEPELPKRVLAIQTDSASFRIRLLETSGLWGNFAALSYCWGPQEETLLRTTSTNLADHLNNIAFETLPKTLQDAIIVANGVGLSYIWIDRLCIVQDNNQDWLDESAVMGSIYKRARVTIAASAAKDPSEGCFRSIRPAQRKVKVPYYAQLNRICGSFYISAISQHLPEPTWEPLRKRAWAFQEWRLSPRIIFFTAGGLGWKCKKFELCERNIKTDFSQYSEWDSFIQDYSGSELTFETDRLIAIQGLVNEMQKSTSDQYNAGIWEADLPLNLLWMVAAVQYNADRLPLVPSWSWASQPGSKLVWSTQEYQLNHAFTASCRMMTENTNIIRLEAPLKQCTISQNEVDQENFLDVTGQSGLTLSPEAAMMDLRDDPVFFIQGFGSQPQHLVGIAALDNEPHTAVHCLFLASSIRSELDPLRYVSHTDMTTHRYAVTTSTNDQEIELHEQEKREARLQSMVEHYGTGRHVCWVLLLQALPKIPGRFRRVGMGLIWAETWARQEISSVSLELV